MKMTKGKEIKAEKEEEETYDAVPTTKSRLPVTIDFCYIVDFIFFIGPPHPTLYSSSSRA